MKERPFHEWPRLLTEIANQAESFYTVEIVYV